MNDFIWVEKYRPHKIEDCILPESIKNSFREFLKQGQVTNMLLHGTAGIGKTTVARALCEADQEIRPLLKTEGLLTRDPRVVERKKPGQKKARKRFQWVKR